MRMSSCVGYQDFNGSDFYDIRGRWVDRAVSRKAFPDGKDVGRASSIVKVNARLSE